MKKFVIISFISLCVSLTYAEINNPDGVAVEVDPIWSSASNSVVTTNDTLFDLPTFTNNGGVITKDNVTAGGVASGIDAWAEGNNTKAFGNNSHAEGSGTIASNTSAHAEGDGTISDGLSGSHAEGLLSEAHGQASHAEGGLTKAHSQFSHAEGNQSIASNLAAHAEGNITVANGIGAHAEGSSTLASGDFSHAEGLSTIASGAGSHAEGNLTVASGDDSHAAGNRAVAEADRTYMWSSSDDSKTNSRAGSYKIHATNGVFIEGDLNVNSNFVMEGYSTGRNVFRTIALRIQPGASPTTNINVSDISGGRGFNAPIIIDATDLAVSGTSGSFSLSADGLVLTLDLTEDVVGFVGTSFKRQNINNSSTTNMYTSDISFSGNNLDISFDKRGDNVIVDFTDVMQAGDVADIYISFITST